MIYSTREQHRDSWRKKAAEEHLVSGRENDLISVLLPLI
jgi:hypothetical protein